MGRLRGTKNTGRHWRSPSIGAAVMYFCLTVAGATHAGTIHTDGRVVPRNEWRLAVGPAAGGLVFDQDLADFRWDTRPAVQSGLRATVYRGRLATGIRILRTHTTQASGIPGETRVPQVNLTAVDILGQARVMRFGGAELWGSAHGGRLHLGYDPDKLAFDPGGGSGVITVDFKPISVWDFGFGLEVRGELRRNIALSLHGEGSTFALDTAHRLGNEIVLSRERFYNWSLRLQFSWLLKLG